jgi:uncharacterized membrane protein
MDFSWMPYMNGFWIFPLLCLIFMALMITFACGGMRFRLGHRDRSSHAGETARQILERRYASGEIDKSQYDAVRRDLNG